MNDNQENTEIIFSTESTSEPIGSNEKIEANFLRPKSFDEYIGQENIIESLSIAVEASKKRDESLDHVLFYGPPGLGKTTLSYIISNHVESNFIHTSGPALERPADAVGLLSNLSSKDVLFIDEIHRIPKPVEEYLYSAMEDFRVDFITGSGAFAKTINLRLENFTLVGSTTRPGLLSSPLRDRFGLSYHLDYYNEDDLTKIIIRSAELMNLNINPTSALEIAKRSRGTPRIANRILRRARDFADIESNGTIDYEIADMALKRMGIDTNGLDDMDRRILNAIIDKFNGGPVGVESLSVAISEDPVTIEEVYEPYLIKEGYIQRTTRGRITLDKAHKYCLSNLSRPKESTPSIFRDSLIIFLSNLLRFFTST